jgi:hypothetical protein
MLIVRQNFSTENDTQIITESWILTVLRTLLLSTEVCSLLWSTHISLNTKKIIFYTVVESILSYGCEMWTVEYRLKKKLLSTETWRRAAITSRILVVRNEAIREKWE